jgi:BASS family bile acid:Na+ symporter
MMMMVVLPLAVYGAARLALPPALAVGVLIVAAMPAGTACSSLTDVVGGNAALALLGTLLTSLVCPLAAPWVIRLGCGQAGGEGMLFLLRQSAFLAAILFVPLGLAFAVRRGFPAFVKRRREVFGALSIVALGLLIFGAMASVSADFWELVGTRPRLALGLFAFMCGFSATLHLAGYFLAPWRPLPDRAALSVNAAYVNNGLAIVFAAEFFRAIPELGASAVLPAILLEAPMALALVPLRAWVNRGVAPGRVPARSRVPVEPSPGAGDCTSPRLERGRFLQPSIVLSTRPRVALFRRIEPTGFSREPSIGGGVLCW